MRIGITRALLRRGLELKGLAPLVLAIIDAILAAIIIMFLALVMVIGVQAFNELAVYGGGDAVLPLGPLFKGIAANPAAAEYWWIYALLFSTVIPSVFNLVIGGASVVRGIPNFAPWLQSMMPVGKAVHEPNRKLIAFALIAQEIIGIILGVITQGAILGAFFLLVLPLFGTNLLGMCRDVAAHNWPIWVGLHLAAIF